uniref:Uncharacterized protein n=1 Tax=Acrobeloides nanus TaxID=290746 RepID=A0A914CSK5_9BILA
MMEMLPTKSIKAVISKVRINRAKNDVFRPITRTRKPAIYRSSTLTNINDETENGKEEIQIKSRKCFKYSQASTNFKTMPTISEETEIESLAHQF